MWENQVEFHPIFVGQGLQGSKGIRAIKRSGSRETGSQISFKWMKLLSETEMIEDACHINFI